MPDADPGVASPPSSAPHVLAIETQNLFFEQYKFECFIEIGPSQTLTGMAIHTLKAKYEAKDDSTSRVHRIFCASKDRKEIYYQFIPFSPSPTSGTDSFPSASPATPSSAPPVSESGVNEELKRRKTITEHMAKLGGIKFSAPPPPPPINRMQPPTPAQPAEDEDAEGSTAVPAQLAPEEEDEDEDEQARRQRIAAKLASMGGMHFGRMLPIQLGMGVIPPPPPPPPIPARLEEEATPRSPPRGIASYPESDQEYEHPSSSDDGVQVEAEESELEEVRHEDLEDEYSVEAIEEERLGTPRPLPPPPRSTRPPIPTGRPPPLPPIGRRPSLEATLASGRSRSFETITSTPRPPPHQGTSGFHHGRGRRSSDRTPIVCTSVPRTIRSSSHQAVGAILDIEWVSRLT